MAQATSSNPVAIVSPQFCCPYPVELAIVRKTKILGRTGNFEATDIKGNLIFNVKEDMKSFHGKQIIFDAAGNPILTIRSKSMSAHSRKQVFRRESTEPKELIFSIKRHSFFQLKNKLDVFLAQNVSEKVCDFQLKGSYSDQNCVVYAGDEDSNKIIAKMDQENTNMKNMFPGKDHFAVTVNPNIDQAFIVSLIVIHDALHREVALAARNAAAAGAAGAASAAAAAATAAAT